MDSSGETVTCQTLLTRRLAVPAAIFLSSRLVMLAVAHAARFVNPQPLTRLLSRWDGQPYLAIVTAGYPSSLPQGLGRVARTEHAFFPGFPLLARGVRALTGLSPVSSALVVNTGLALVAAVLIWLLARDLIGETAATRSVALFSFFPGAFVLGLVYSEGAFLAFASACLLALQRRSWLAAGLSAAAAGATRPTGLVLTLCCAWAAAMALRRSRQWSALMAPALAPLGFLAWSAYLEVHTGSAIAWKRSQEQGWRQGFDLGANTARSVGRFLLLPLANFKVTACVLTVAVVGVGLVLLWRWRPPGILLIYTAGILFPALASAVLTSTPRFVLSAFPLHMAFGRYLSGMVFAVVLAVSAGLMVLLMMVAELSPAFTP